MRLWSIHPKHLDVKGLVACWREGLLALNVLQGNTKGYKMHPQLNRFKTLDNPVVGVSDYLHVICDEADNRGYNFDRSKLLQRSETPAIILVTSFQVGYEWGFLEYKIDTRKGIIRDGFNPYLFTLKQAASVVHPMFETIPGQIESWEKVLVTLTE